MSEDVEERIEDAVFSLMKTTDIPKIKVGEVVRLAGVSRSTFYRHFDSVDAVVKRFEEKILDNMRSINKVAFSSRFTASELDPTPTMVLRMNVLKQNRDKILALNGEHGDPQFVHKGTIVMHDRFRDQFRNVPFDRTEFDLYLAYSIAGHHNLIQYWLEERPDLDAARVARTLNKLFYAPFFLDEDNPGRPQFPHQ